MPSGKRDRRSPEFSILVDRASTNTPSVFDCDHRRHSPANWADVSVLEVRGFALRYHFIGGPHYLLGTG